MIKANFHTHTVFCDGKNTAEEMVVAAIEKGFKELGFSSHSYVDYATPYGLKMEDSHIYKAEISRLKTKYADKIKVYCGIELDSFSHFDTSGYDYVIASVHGVEKNGKIYEVDHSEKTFLNSIREGWNGDVYAYAEDYFEAVSNQKGDIIGHIDLLCKFNEGDRLFSTKNERYLAAAEKAVKKLCSNNALLEINTGAIGRGYRTTPYPSEDILKMIKKYGGRLIITSDCHNKDYLDCGFELAEKMAGDIGIKVNYTLWGM